MTTAYFVAFVVATAGVVIALTVRYLPRTDSFITLVGLVAWLSYVGMMSYLGVVRNAAGMYGSVGWHTFRHTYRSWLDETGAPIGVQQKLMRHAQISTTMNVYGKRADGSEAGSQCGRR